MPKINRYTKEQRLKFYQKKQRKADFKDGIQHSCIRKMNHAKIMANYELEAKKRGIPICQVIAEAIQ